MRISVLSIGIEIAEAVVEVLSSEEIPSDPQRPEAAGTQLSAPVLHGFRAEASVIFEVPGRPEALLADALHRVRGNGVAGRIGEAFSPSLMETGRLGLKGVLARSALVVLPALAVLVAPKVARAALPAARNNARLQSWMKGFLPAPPPPHSTSPS